MGWDNDTLNAVFDKTDGHCRYCEKKLSRINHGVIGARGAWEIDHSVPKALGGTDCLQNLQPACLPCNRSKGTLKGTQYSRQFEEDDEFPLAEVAIGIGAVVILTALFCGLMQNQNRNPNSI